MLLWPPGTVPQCLPSWVPALPSDLGVSERFFLQVLLPATSSRGQGGCGAQGLWGAPRSGHGVMMPLQSWHVGHAAPGIVARWMPGAWNGSARGIMVLLGSCVPSSRVTEPRAWDHSEDTVAPSPSTAPHPACLHRVQWGTLLWPWGCCLVTKSHYQLHLMTR